MTKVFFIVLINVFITDCKGQYKWNLEKDKQGLKVYSSTVPNSDYKAIKVEGNFTGSYSRLISILTNVSLFSSWIYHSKTNRVVKKDSPLDFVYHTETEMPWPLANRDAVIHLKISTDSLPKFLIITGRSEPGLVPLTPGLVRINHYKADWKVTQVSNKILHINYRVEVDPEGNIPGWMSNMFVEKGPYETFSNLAKKLKQ